MKYRVRYFVEHEVVLDVPSAQHAAASIPHQCKVLGVLPDGQQWPDREDFALKPRPPRNTPPSGSPGTPTTQKPSKLAHAVAA